jgi:uncharacterized membrane protein
MNEERIHQLFTASVALKGVHALIEIVSGLALYFTSTATVVQVIGQLAKSELIEDPDDFIALHLVRFAQGFSPQAHHFYAFYLLSHGLVKSALVVGLLREKLWAYPASFAVFGAFIAYQLYRYSYTHDLGLIFLSLFDAMVILLAVHEYRLLRQRLPTH